MAILLDLNRWRNIRAWNEICVYIVCLIIVLVTFVRLCTMQKVRFLQTLLIIMGFNCIEGLYSGIYWSDYFPGPFVNNEPGKF